MPNATVDSTPQKYNLDSLPSSSPGEEDGFIMARPLPYGMKLTRRDRAMRMRMEQQVRTDRRKTTKKSIRQDEPETQTIELETDTLWATLYDFTYCIVDHNLTDVNGTQLDLSKALTLNHLDPRVGTEIEQILAELNADTEEEEQSIFTTQPTHSLSQEDLKEPETIQA